MPPPPPPPPSSLQPPPRPLISLSFIPTPTPTLLPSYHFQTAPLKRKFMALNLYSSACAVASYWLMAEAARFRLLNYDAWGRCFIFFRPVQWIHTTPGAPPFRRRPGVPCRDATWRPPALFAAPAPPPPAAAMLHQLLMLADQSTFQARAPPSSRPGSLPLSLPPIASAAHAAARRAAGRSCGCTPRTSSC